MKKIIQISVLILLSAAFFFFLSKRNIIDIKLLQNALHEHKLLLAGIACAQTLNHIIMALRYKYILKILNLEKKTENVVSSTLVSNSIGQWLPGSLAFIEVIRIGLMIKRQKKFKLSSSDKIHLATASLFDRIIGFFVALILGTILTFYFLFKISDSTIINHFILLGVFLLNMLLVFLIILLPMIASSKHLERILIHAERACLKLVSHSAFQQIVTKIFCKINDLIKIFAENGKQYHLFLAPMGFTLISIGLFTLSIHFAWLALGSTIPFLETVALNSMFSISVLVPISVGGIGVPQLIIAILYSALGVNPSYGASAQLLVISVTLVIISLCGLIYLPRIIKEIIKPRIA